MRYELGDDPEMIQEDFDSGPSTGFSFHSANN